MHPPSSQIPPTSPHDCGHAVASKSPPATSPPRVSLSPADQRPLSSPPYPLTWPPRVILRHLGPFAPEPQRCMEVGGHEVWSCTPHTPQLYARTWPRASGAESFQLKVKPGSFLNGFEEPRSAHPHRRCYISCGGTDRCPGAPGSERGAAMPWALKGHVLASLATQGPWFLPTDTPWMDTLPGPHQQVSNCQAHVSRGASSGPEL